MPSRRKFLKTLAVVGGVSTTGGVGTLLGIDEISAEIRQLPDVQVNPYSVEIVLNSRYSSHSGYSPDLSDQILANALWAAGKAPIMGGWREIYVALPDNLYIYDPDNHDLAVHLSGDHITESNQAAFEIGVAAELVEDAGISIQYAHLAVVSFWSQTSGQPGCCTKTSAADDANAAWNPNSTIHTVNCYGRCNVSGMTDTLVATSSDGSLPDPNTDGALVLEEALENLNHSDQFSSKDLTKEQISQLAWAAYGCSPHTASGGRAGLTCASAMADYYLTGGVYIAHSGGVDIYHCRTPSGGAQSRDHRLEQVTDEDKRPELRDAVPDIPQDAPVYFAICVNQSGYKPLLEAGFCGGSALLQATALELNGFLTSGFSSGEQSDISSALSIPGSFTPSVIFSVGQPSDNDTDTETGGDSDIDGDTDSDSDGDTDGDSDGDTDGDSDGDTDGDADSDTDGDADGDADSDSDGDADSDGDGDADGDDGGSEKDSSCGCETVGETEQGLLETIVKLSK